ILDEDRKINAQKFESAFYSNPDLRNVKPPQEQPVAAPALDINTLVVELTKSPELLAALSQLVAAQSAAK
ncbi:MAG: site-specific integrase, partial [Oscillospiraceae bacterium]